MVRKGKKNLDNGIIRNTERETMAPNFIILLDLGLVIGQDFDNTVGEFYFVFFKKHLSLGFVAWVFVFVSCRSSYLKSKMKNLNY